MTFLFLDSAAAGYIALGALAFVFGILVTLLCIRVRDLNKEKKHE